MQIVHNPARCRYELALDGDMAIADYRRTGDVMIVYHTEVPRALEGRGIGSALAKGVLDDARAQGLKVKPTCPFVGAYISRHPEYADLRA
jgi:predicted GNAT family acetyltransferase